MPMHFICAHSATCLPDYWSGHHLPHVSIATRKGMTSRQVSDALRAELLDGAIMGQFDDTDEEYEAMMAAVGAIKYLVPTHFNDLPDSAEDDETVYAYFVFMPFEPNE